MRIHTYVLYGQIIINNNISSTIISASSTHPNTMARFSSTLLLGLVVTVTPALFGSFAKAFGGNTDDEHQNLRALPGGSRITQGKPNMIEIMCGGEIKSVPEDVAPLLLTKNENCKSVVTEQICVGAVEQFQVGDACGPSFLSCCGFSTGVSL